MKKMILSTSMGEDEDKSSRLQQMWEDEDKPSRLQHMWEDESDDSCNTCVRMKMILSVATYVRMKMNPLNYNTCEKMKMMKILSAATRRRR